MSDLRQPDQRTLVEAWTTDGTGNAMKESIEFVKHRISATDLVFVKQIEEQRDAALAELAALRLKVVELEKNQDALLALIIRFQKIQDDCDYCQQDFFDEFFEAKQIVAQLQKGGE